MPDPAAVREWLCVVQVDRSGQPVHLDLYRDWETLLAARVTSEDFGPFDGWQDVSRVLLKASRNAPPIPRG